jgi:hypothetical protein
LDCPARQPIDPASPTSGDDRQRVGNILGLIWLPLGQLAAWLVWPFSVYTIRLKQAYRFLLLLSYEGKFSVFSHWLS